MRILGDLKVLLRTGRPKPNESLMGFILRLTELNHYKIPAWIIGLAGLGNKKNTGSFSFVFRKSVDLSLLAHLSNVSLSELNKLTYPPTDSSISANRNSIYGFSVPQYIIRIRYPKICPSCLLESNYCRMQWDLALVTACPSHECLLLDECPCCKRRLTWTREKVSVCICGFNWRDLVPQQLSDSELELTRQVYRICNLQLGSNCKTTHPSNTNPILTLGLEDLISAIFFIAGQFEGIIDTKGKFLAPKRRNIEIHSLLIKALDVFDNWPVKFFSFLDWRQIQKKDARYVGGLRRDFGEYKSALYQQLSPTTFDFMRSAFEIYLTTQWDGGYVNSIKRLNGTIHDNKKYMSKTEARIQLKCDVKWIESLIEKGKIKAVIRNYGRNKLTLIEIASVEELKHEFMHSLGLKEVSNLLSVCVKGIKRLAEHRCLLSLRGPTSDGSKIWRFSRTEVDKLLNQVSIRVAKSNKTNAGDKLEFLAAVGRLAICKFNMGRFVRAILDGEIKPIREVAKPGLHRFIFSKKQITEYAQEQRRIQKGEQFYVIDAAKILNINPTLTYSLATKNILPTKERTDDHLSKILITKDAIEFFKATYVLPSALAPSLGVSSRTIVNILKANNINPVSGPIVDSGIQYVFMKEEIDQINLTDLVAKVRQCKKRRILDINEAAQTLNMTISSIKDLVRKGVIRPYSYLSANAQDSEVYFSYAIILKHKKLSINYADLVSISVAAKMFNESSASFYQSWVNTKRIKCVKLSVNGRLSFFRQKDVEVLLSLKQETMTSREVAIFLATNIATITRWIKSGRLKTAQKPAACKDKYHRFWRSDIEKFKEQLKDQHNGKESQYLKKSNQKAYRNM